ncbi:OsmC family protein [Piscinibacter sp.]|jgi:organic hydroperoxide reductase OsmC/OhrA|uniref:OsmC family protein n=1 Tax=Piscinibacter sp. TaxID=1903157 RepID=UPI003559F55A
METSFAIDLVQQADYRFEVRFDNPAVPVLVTDENAPLGRDAGPSPSRLLGTAVANCLAASLLFSMRKFKNTPDPIRARATVSLARNEQKRLRIGHIGVDLHLGVPAAKVNMLDRILAQFEDFCVITQSVRAAFPVDVRVFDSDGVLLEAPAAADAAMAA